MNSTRGPRAFTLFSFVFSCALFAGVLFVLPSASVHDLVGEKITAAYKVYGFLVFATLLLTLFTFVLWRIFLFSGEKKNPSPRVARKLKWGRPLVYFQIVCSVVILVRAGSGIRQTFDWDEIATVSGLNLGERAVVMSPFRGANNHPLATVVSFLSMKVFGVSKVGARLPALGFALLFLALLNFFCLRYASPLTTIILFAHFTCNSLVVWYMHSMRGYIPMMLFTFGAFLILYDFTLDGVINRRKMVSFAVLTTLAALTHTVGYLFSVLLLLSFGAWLYFTGESLPQKRLAPLRNFLLALCLWFGVLGLLCVLQMAELYNDKFIVDAAPWPQNEMLQRSLSRLAMALGVARVWALKLICLLTLAVTLFAVWRRKIDYRNFPTVFNLLAVTVLSLSAWLLRAPVVEGRMVLPFLPIFLFWLGEALVKIPVTGLRTALVGYTLVILTVPQVANRHSLLHDDLEYFEGHEAFARRVRELVGDPRGSCFTFAGEPQSVQHARGFTLREASPRELAGDCATHYVVYFSRDRFQRPVPLDLPEGFTPQDLREVYGDGRGSHLYSYQKK